MSSSASVRLTALSLALAMFGILSGCMDNVQDVRFEGTPRVSTTVKLARADLDQDGGSPTLSGSTNFQLSKSSVGKNFLKTEGASSSYRFRGGIYHP